MSTVSAITIAQCHTALIAVATAVDSGDYAAAHVELLKAEICLAGLPLTNVKEGLTAQMRSSLDAVRKALEEAQKRSSGSRFEKHSRWVP